MSEQHTDNTDQEKVEEQGKQALMLRSMEFYGDELVAVMTPDKQIWVHLVRLVESLGLSLSDQLEHIRGNKTLHVGPTIQAVYGMLYREFGVTVYRNLPRNRFDEVMRLLEETKGTMLGGK